MTDNRIAQLAINTIRTLSIDAIQQANSGHPGTPMGMAPVVYCLWQHFLRFDPEDPIWPNRDRFVLSAGHASMLLYSMLHLTGVKAVDPDYEIVGNPSRPSHPLYSWTLPPGLPPRSAAPAKVFSGSLDTIRHQTGLANRMLSVGRFCFFNSATYWL